MSRISSEGPAASCSSHWRVITIANFSDVLVCVPQVGTIYYIILGDGGDGLPSQPLQ